MTLTNQTLSEAAQLADYGVVSNAEWRAYAHRWQTGAPRFELRVCHCDDCKRNFPFPDFRAAYTREWWDGAPEANEP